MTFADTILNFNQTLELNVKLPENIHVLHPFKENPEVITITTAFYKKFYDDHLPRKMILGINPGRLGAGATGIPFTDPKRLLEKCDIETSYTLHEPSSVFIYEVIEAYGGTFDFYNDFFISSVCPLGFVQKNKNGKLVNYNYYDSVTLTKIVTPFITASLRAQLEFGIERKEAFCLGTGKNYRFLKKLNDEYDFFEGIVPLEHPRYVMQYKSKEKQEYIAKYVRLLRGQ
ncbi:uracil-DNA glycosylase family protein [Ascidiimonas aurantiaca]|uniref:uracil-DNA glycosylase family protein n=1 Tax=Ascidiimonas aurantiaca TaxID=1685432 RepID=UPI0030ECAC4F